MWCHAFADPDRGRNACRNRRESMLNLRDSMLSRWFCDLEVPEQDPRKHGESMLNLRDCMLSRWFCDLEVPEQDPRKHGTHGTHGTSWHPADRSHHAGCHAFADPDRGR